MRAVKTIALLAAWLLSFGGGALTAGICHWFQPVVAVTIKNVSGQSITSMKLIVNSEGYTSLTQLKPLAHGESLTTHFFVAGEAGYSLEVVFADGRIIKGGAGYVEPGYSTSEFVYFNIIKSTY